MNLACRHCGDTYDIDTLHDQAAADNKTFDEVRADFYARGCEVLDGHHHNEPLDPDKADGITAIYELLGDDVDGAAALLEDFGFADF